MSTRALGIDLSDVTTDLVFSVSEEVFSFPTAIFKDNDKEEWYVGEEAYKKLLDGSGTMTDRLLSLSTKHKTATLGGIKYKGKDLLKKFFQTIIEIGVVSLASGYPEEIVVSVPMVGAEIVGMIVSCFVDLGYLKNHVHVISRCESFISYTIHQNPKIWNNLVGLFYCAEQELTYYEFTSHSAGKKKMLTASADAQKEGFDLTVLRMPQGAKLGDQILTTFAQNKMQAKKRYSSVILAGKGFEDHDWAGNFKNFIASGRRSLYLDVHLFAIGACKRALEFIYSGKQKDFTYICDGRLSTSVYIHTIEGAKVVERSLANAGDSWYTLENNMRVIADDISHIELSVIPVNINRRKIVKIPLSDFSERPKKTLRLDLKTRFKDSKTMIVEITDAGFGEIVKSTNKQIVKEVDLWDL